MIRMLWGIIGGMEENVMVRIATRKKGQVSRLSHKIQTLDSS